MKSLLPLILSVFLASSLIAQVTIDPPSRSFTKDGGAGAILTQGSGSWTASTADSWITITPRTSGTVGESCIYVVSSNFSADTRIGQVNVSGNIHTVSQFGYPATLTPSNVTVDLDGDTGSVSISVAAGVSWTATSNSGWIEVSPSSGLSSGSVTYTVEPNPGVTTRNGSLTIAGQTFTVTQTGTDVNLSPKSVEKAYSSDIIQLQVTALVGTNWTVTPNAPWISVVDDGNGFGDSQITLAVGTNPSFLERTGTVTIGSATFTVVQAGTPNPVLDIVPDAATADPVGAYGNAAILATPDAPWTAESEEPWIIIADGATGAGNGNIEYVVSSNPNLAERSGRIRVAPPVYTPDVDLTWLLYSHINNDDIDLTGWGRGLDADISTPFDGTNPRNMLGQSLYRDNDAFSVAFWFTINDSNAINRLFEAQASAATYTTLYTNANNRLILSAGGESLSSDLIVTPGIEYQLVLSVDDAGLAELYCAPRTDEITEVGAKTFVNALFPYAYIEPEHISLGNSEKPTPGNLDNATIDDLRLYGRAINVKEVIALAENAGTATPYGDTSHGGDPATTVEYNFRGQGLVTGGTLPLVSKSDFRYEIEADNFTEFDSRTVNRGSSVSITYPENNTLFTIYAIEGVGKGGGWDQGSSSPISWRYKFVYADGSSYWTPQRSVGYGAITHVELNPYPHKPVNSILISASASGNYGVPSLVSSIRGIAGALVSWSPSNDRFGGLSGSLTGNEFSYLAIQGHEMAFTQPSATYNMWVKVSDVSKIEEQPIFNRGNFSVALQNGGQLLLKLQNDTVEFASGVRSADWHMLTISAAYGGTLKAYVDGVEIGNTSIFSDYLFGRESIPTLFIIGGWEGSIDYLGFYDEALSSPQIASLFNAQKFDYQYHTVTQGTVTPAVSPTSSAFAASGGSGSVDLTIAGNVNWSASASSPWISLTSASSGIGSTTATFDVSANTSVYERQGTVTIAGEPVLITQAGLGSTLDYSELIFGTDGGSDWIDVAPEANGSWEAVSNDSWLTIAIGASGTGPGSVLVVADPYSQTSQSRTGTLEVAGQTIYVTQRGYQLSVNPQIGQVGSNSGAGEFGVAAPISAVWEAITTQEWISINGSSTGVGNGTLRYTVATNNTGATRTGRIIVSGTEYTITQVSSLQVSATADSGGSVNGSGGYETNATATLTAIPTTGYAFSHWTGDAVGSTNPLNLSVESDKDVVAHFIPSSAATSFETAGQNAVLSNPNAYDLYEESQLRTMAVGNPFLAVDTATNKLTVGFGLQQTDDLSNWSPVNVQASQTFIRDGNIEVELTVDADAKFYQIITE
jgi:hypothetical protein